MQRIALMILLLLSAVPCTAQQVLGNAGDHFTNAQTDLAYTLGESVVPTLSNGSHTATQGFHQPIEVSPVTAMDEDGFEPKTKVYPNPVRETVHIWLAEDAWNRSFQVLDLTGKVLRTGHLEPGETALWLGDLPIGHYLISIRAETTQSTESFRILKH